MGSCSVRSFICSRPLRPMKHGVAKQQDRLFPTCPVSPHSLFPAISAMTLFLFLLSPWHGSKQAASRLCAPLLIAELQHRGDTGPGGKLGTGEELTAANREQKLTSMSLLSSFCSLREDILIASLFHPWSYSSLGVFIPFSFHASSVKTEESCLLFSQGKGGLPCGVGQTQTTTFLGSNKTYG